MNRLTPLQSLRGMEDVWGEQTEVFRWIEQLCWQKAQKYHYQEIKTPLLEATEVFHRTLGETSDAIQKETYTFLDRGGESVTLRPEGTASVVRALISNQLFSHLPLKFYYAGPMFRYERPQKGRLRQFHQIGVEAIGFQEPWSDVESLLLAFEILCALGLKDQCMLEINTLGDEVSRSRHREAFIKYLEQHKLTLSKESQIRLEKNPLRIFDSKDPQDQEIVKLAPQIRDYLTIEAGHFFEKVIQGLETFNIPYKFSPHLVRGFDYYTHSVFEFTTSLLGAQSAILSGGRYNHLVQHMGGAPTSCIGWALGVERIYLLVKDFYQKPEIKSIAVLPIDETTHMQALAVAQQLRHQGWIVDLYFDGKIAKRIQKAEKKGFQFVGFLGPEELKHQNISIKELKTGNQTILKLENN